jgi:hypothetical protein
MQKNPNAVTVTIAPFVRDVIKDANPTVVWEADGNDTIFPSSNFFSWKSGGPGSNPTRSSDGKTLTLTYSVSSPSTWSYAISLENAGVKVTVDPDIHNDPPIP